MNCESCNFFPSLEDEPKLMALTIDALAEVGKVTRLIFVQKRDIEYDESQVVLLSEVAQVYKKVIKQKLTRGIVTSPQCSRVVSPRYTAVQNLLYRLMKQDPIGAYVELRRMARDDVRSVKEGLLTKEDTACLSPYLRFVEELLGAFEETQIIKKADPFLAGLRVGDRSIYRRLFNPTIKPDFMFTKVAAQVPLEGTELASYQVGDTEITIFDMPESVQYLYHMVPAEFKLTEEKYELLDAARKIMAEHQPKRSEFVDPARMREVFENVGMDLLDELSSQKGIHLTEKDKQELANILVRYTVGFGLVELLLADDKVQDISINSPMGRIPMFIVHSEFGDCTTNIVPTSPEGESWASKLRLISGRPLDEANPILDTELVLPAARARISAITEPLNPTGLAFSFRRHRDKPWTLPLFINNKMLTPLAAGVLSFLIDGSRTMLVAGTRSSGKTSLLGSVMVDIMRRSRIITIEDTLELPGDALRNLGYNIQSMKVASALTRGSNEVSADEGIRTTLRLGDSSLIVGEVRSVEARALYEAMRVGALANVVAGTIHGDSPYGVFDRVVNDLGVPRTSFKATDVIVVANPVRSPDGIHRFRRVTQITEVRKLWEDDPLTEGGFVDLFKYDPQVDALVPTNDLLRGDSDVIKAVAGSVKEWAGNWDAVWDNINLRAQIKEELVKISKELKRPELLEAEFYIRANDEFHRVSESVREDVGSLDSKRILFEWKEWLKGAVRR
jgi:type IV secretory pathway ATPase VirB11/archaellum biosynthesis ATPase